MKHIIATLLLTFLIAGCKRSQVKDPNPAICPTDQFSHTGLVHASTAALASAGGFKLVDTLSESVDWYITIRGNASGAVKRYADRSSKINLTWYGEPDTALFFQLETCTVTLQFACREATHSSFTIFSKPTFTNVPDMLLISNFEGQGVTTTWGANGNHKAFGDVITAPADPSPQGGNYYQFDGASVAPDYYFGSFYTGGTSFKLPATWTDPSKVFVNFFANNNGVKNSEVQVVGTPQILGQTYRRGVNWTGWKLVSYSLDNYEFVEPHKITGFTVGVGSTPNRGTSATIKFDFLIVTYGKPFYKEVR
jgi:hypothetical protein